MMQRREWLVRTTSAAAWLAMAPLLANAGNRRFKIGAPDWSLRKQCDVAAFQIAKEIGLDGVQVSLGTVANNLQLRQAAVQQQYKAAASQTGVAIASMAIGELNSVPYKSDPRTIEWVSDCVDVMQALEVKVVLLAFFGKGDLCDDQAGVDEVVKRLKVVAPKAEKAGVVLGLENYLSAEQNLDILQRVGSHAVQVYYDVGNSIHKGYDIYKEIRMLKGKICEFHAKDGKSMLGAGQVDFHKVRAAMDEIGYSGWIQIEAAAPHGVVPDYQADCKFLKGIFS